ncbi:hypothetical protein [Mangrovicoccus ximenensis]|uniref:hypothetical protein n=1 Tax=Mangrovicoccus ximenensis TaxID=1911570 RepID=UPI00191C3B2B|nr:hypothetical protein [Mangrovicoccus ximenensis]
MEGAPAWSIAPLWADLTTEYGGQVIWLAEEDRVTVQYAGVRSFSGEIRASFSMELRRDGDIAFSYGDRTGLPGDFAIGLRGGTRGDSLSLEAPPGAGSLRFSFRPPSVAGADVDAGPGQLLRIAEGLLRGQGGDYGAPDIRGMMAKSRALFVSDFLGPMDRVEAALTQAADRGVRGALLQVLDPEEEAFPFDGRTVFESMGGGIAHETLQAASLRGRYLERLAERKARLADLARLTGWQFACHHTGESAQSALLWLYGAMEKTR